ncbi:MAG: chorismate mutase [Candidatus Woesearchaeota archaeon]
MREIRKRLDRLDKELVILLAERMSLIQKLAEYKKKNKILVCQPEREKKIIDGKKKLGKKLGLNPRLVEDLFKRIIKESCSIQKGNKA